MEMLSVGPSRALVQEISRSWKGKIAIAVAIAATSGILLRCHETSAEPRKAHDGETVPKSDKSRVEQEQAEKAKEALLSYMKSHASDFPGLDIEKLASVKISLVGDGEYAWGAFKIHVTTRTFSAVIQVRQEALFYDGDFKEDPDRSWSVSKCDVRRAQAPRSR